MQQSIASALPEPILFLGVLALKPEHEPGRSVSLARRLSLHGWANWNIIFSEGGILAYVIRKVIHRGGGYVAILPRFGIGRRDDRRDRSIGQHSFGPRATTHARRPWLAAGAGRNARRARRHSAPHPFVSVVNNGHQPVVVRALIAEAK
jgi:hypothetical protein